MPPYYRDTWSINETSVFGATAPHLMSSSILPRCMGFVDTSGPSTCALFRTTITFLSCYVPQLSRE